MIGSTGSGKSTVMRLLIKELEPTEGMIRVAGRDLSTITRKQVPYLPPQHRRRLPGLQAAAEPDRLRQRRLRAPGHRPLAQGDPRAGSGHPAPDRALDQAAQLPGPAVRRRAAARLDRARVRQPPAAAAGRRADRQPRSRRPASTSCGCSTGSTAPARPCSWPPTTTRWSTRCAAACSSSRSGRIVRDEATGLYPRDESTREFAHAPARRRRAPRDLLSRDAAQPRFLPPRVVARDAPQRGAELRGARDVTVTLIVVGVFIPIVQATRGAANSVRSRVLVEVYMKDRRDPAQDDARVLTELKAIPNVQQVGFESKAAGAGAAEEAAIRAALRAAQQQPAPGHLPRVSDEPGQRARDPRGDRRQRCRRQRPDDRSGDRRASPTTPSDTAEAADRHALRDDHRRAAGGCCWCSPRSC